MKKLYKDTNIKICGIKEIETANYLIKNSVRFFGLIFYNKSPRYIKITDAMKLNNLTIDTKTNAVGVFVDYSIKEVERYIKNIKLKYIQLHGNENESYIKTLKENNNIKIIKAVGIRSLKDVRLSKKYMSADYLLFDYKTKKINDMPGGNAKKFNWNLLQNTLVGKKWFLSGGINEKNIDEALNYLNPFGIDISSGVENSIGVKSIKKISNILAKINKSHEH